MKNIKSAYKILFVIVLAMVFLVPSYNVKADENDIFQTAERINNGEIVPVEEVKKVIEENQNPEGIGNRILLNTLEEYVKKQEKKAKKEKEEKEATKCTYVLGDPNKDGSFANMMQKILNYIKIIAPILVVLLSGFDFAKNALTGDADEMKKATKKLGIRLACAVGVYLAPLITGFLINFINNSSVDQTCNIK
jgi:hypothetical protein